MYDCCNQLNSVQVNALSDPSNRRMDIEQENSMIGISVAAALGFAFGAAFKADWILVHAPVAAVSSVLSYTFVSQML